MILLNLRTVPRASDVVFELVCVYENQWAQERNEYDQAYIENAEKRVHLEYTVSHENRADQGEYIIGQPESMPHQVSENGHESKYAQRNVQKSKHFGSLLQTGGKQDRGKENGVDTRRCSKEHSLLTGVLLFLFGLNFLSVVLGLLVALTLS